MRDLINKIVGSLDTHTKNSFSARKLSALIVMACVVVAHIKWFKSDKWEYLGEVLIIDMTFILCCLGLTTWQSIKDKKKNENTTDTAPTSV